MVSGWDWLKRFSGELLASNLPDSGAEFQIAPAGGRRITRS